jgi:hypothetical protein
LRERAARKSIGTAQEKHAFEQLLRIVVAEARRINGLMYCARLRCLIMPTRFEVLVQLRSVSGVPRQPVDARASDYLAWLLDEAERLRPSFMKSIEDAVSSFNRATAAADVGVDLPFDLWRKNVRTGNISLGDVVEMLGRRRGKLARYLESRETATYAVVTNANEAEYQVNISGESSPIWVERRLVQPCRGAAVFLPGPLKLRARAEHKVSTDYCDEPDPPAASLLDLVRATVVFEEPYALACFVQYVQKTMRVVRLKNRFEHDDVERISASRLQQEFYAAEAWGHDDADSVASGDSGRADYSKMYRDVMLNIEIPREGGDPFIAELQVVLSGIAILKKSEQVVYSIMRMKRPADLLDIFVFDLPELAGHTSLGAPACDDNFSGQAREGQI